ncbi:MAG: GAF domain-containing protein [Deltaproteobacteria bacterium]|nr:GAF domain-containing protein [Deltaproteobacteria bacterium]
MRGMEMVVDRDELSQRVAFERLMALVTTELVSTPTERLDATVESALARVASVMAADRAYVFIFSEDGARITCTHQWCSPGTTTGRLEVQDLPVERFPWAVPAIKRGRSLELRELADLPPESAAVAERLRALGIKSLLALPISVAGRVVGSIGLDWYTGPAWWDDDSVALMRVIGDLVAGSVTRQRAERELRASEARLRSFIANTTDAVWCYEHAEGVPTTLTIDEQFEMLLTARLVECNDAYARSHDSTREALLGRTMSELSRASRERLRRLLAELHAAGGEGRDFEVELVVPGQEPRVLSIYLRLLEESGRITRVWGSFRDITAARAVERERASLQLQLADVRRRLADAYSTRTVTAKRTGS